VTEESSGSIRAESTVGEQSDCLRVSLLRCLQDSQSLYAMSDRRVEIAAIPVLTDCVVIIAKRRSCAEEQMTANSTSISCGAC
jgi:hypothetical protein